MNEIKDKTIMVDVDGTLIDFVTMFFDKIYDYFGIKLNPEDCVDYNFNVFFKKMGIPEEVYKNFYKIWNTYVEYNGFYAIPVFTNEYFNIMQFLKKYKEQGYKIILNSKCPTEVMLNSKKKFIEKELPDNIFDEIIYDQNLLNHKPFNYDIIVENNPFYIEEYIKRNPKGKVWLVEQPYNTYLLSKYLQYIIKE